MYLPNPVLSCKTVVSNRFGARDWFHRRQFSHSPGIKQAWFCTDSRSLHLSRTLSLVLFHQLHLRLSGTGSWRLGNPSCKVKSFHRFQGQDGGKFWEVEASGNLSASHMGSSLVFVRLEQLGIRFSSLICLRWRLWQRTFLPRQETETWV